VFQVQPQRTDVIQDASVGIGAAPKDSVLIVSATVTDLSGAVSEIMTRTIPVIVPPPDTTDTSTVAAATTHKPLFLAVAPLPTWSPPVPAGSPEDVAQPARRLLRLRAVRKRRT
jgi:hypothetical protein